MFENKNSRGRDCRFCWPTAESGATAEREHAIFGQCRYDAPRAQGSAYEYGYFEMMKRVIQMALATPGHTDYLSLIHI